MEIEITKYSPALKNDWDQAVAGSPVGTFLLMREYMDYHSDRFSDHSLLARRQGKLLALLPASLDECGTLSSHAGLTYGGWITASQRIDGSCMLDIFEAWIHYMRRTGIKKAIYKPLPYIFASRPSQEDLYALWRTGFSLNSRLLSSAVDLRNPWKFDMSKRQQARKALRSGIIIGESSDWPGFWSVLCQCLQERHEVSPVHSLQEIMMLAGRFPKNIRLFTATDEAGCILAGVVIYDTGRVAHSQYAATTAQGRKDYALTALYHSLLTDIFTSRAFFDFGTSNEQGGQLLNSGLLSQKFSMGATGVAFDTYSLTL